MLPQQILDILCYFDVCGVNSGSSKVSRNKRATYLIYFVHITTAILLSLFEFHLMSEYYPSLGLIEAISESLEYKAALYTYWLIILDSVVHRRVHEQFWNILQHIDDCFSSQPKCAIRSYVVKFNLYILKTVSIMVIRLTISSITGFIIDFAYIVLFIVCEIRMFYYLFCLEILHMQLKIVEDELKTMMNILSLASFREDYSSMGKTITISAYDKFEFQRMKWIREYYLCVYQMMCNLNEIFGWSHVGAIMFCFYYLLTESNWFYIHFDELSFTHRVGECFHCILIELKFNQSFKLVHTFFQLCYSQSHIGNC